MRAVLFLVAAALGLAALCGAAGRPSAAAQTPAVSPFTLTVTTDKATYAAGEAVAFRLSLSYTSETPLPMLMLSSPFTVVLRDAAGTEVARLPTLRTLAISPQPLQSHETRTETFSMAAPPGVWRLHLHERAGDAGATGAVGGRLRGMKRAEARDTPPRLLL